ncbi:MAG: hypothetical protein IJ180_00390 [Bacteroidales bacterium]|nr:hypothetical protein [Bacteroidales bacterium]
MIKFTKELSEEIDSILKGFSEEELAQKLVESHNEIEQVNKEVLNTSYAQSQINIIVNISYDFEINESVIGFEKAA